MISIVLPVYNVEKYLKQCLESLLKQTYKDYELLIINDGSTDNSLQICEKYEKKFDNVKIITKKNEGLGFARNTGIKNANGDSILFLDSDDFFSPTLLEKLLFYKEKENTDTCVGSFKRVDERGNITGDYGRANYEVFTGDDVQKELLPRLMGSLPDKHDGIVISACNTLYDLRIIKKNNIFFKSEREITSEDLFFNMDYFRFSKGAVFSGERLYYYRINPSSLSHKYRDNRFDMKQKIYIEGKKKLEEAGIYDAAIIRFMKYYLIGMRVCIRQETPKVSGKKITECRKAIRIICENEILKEILKVYPIRRLETKQRLFVYLLKYKCVDVLELLAVLGMME